MNKTLLMTALVTVAACGGEFDPPLEPLETDQTDSELILQNPWPTTTIPVCWDPNGLTISGSATGLPRSIPDGNPTGVTNTIQMPTGLTSYSDDARFTVDVDITHTYIGDLRVVLAHKGHSWTLHNMEGGSTDNIRRSYTVTAPAALFASETWADGQWTLTVYDLIGVYAGTLNNWSLRFAYISDARRTTIRNAIERAWSIPATRIGFTGWGTTCPDPIAVRHIRLHPVYSDAVAGNAGDIGVSNGLRIVSFNFHRTVDQTFGWVHELGHVLGLRHAMEDPQGTSSCYWGHIAADPSWRGPNDPRSIMSYCAVNPTATPTAFDLWNVNRVYGFPGTYFVDQNGARVRYYMTSSGLRGCLIQGSAQLSAFAGELNQSNPQNILIETYNDLAQYNYPACSWPDGIYRNVVWDFWSGQYYNEYPMIMNGTVCTMSGPKAAAYRGTHSATQLLPSGTNYRAGSPALTDVGTCAWPEAGYYRVLQGGVSRTYEVTIGGYCEVSEDQWNIIIAPRGYQRLTGDATTLRGTNQGVCPWPEAHYYETGRTTTWDNVIHSYGGARQYCTYESALHLTSESVTEFVAVNTMSPTNPSSPIYGAFNIGACKYGPGIYRWGTQLIGLPSDNMYAYCRFRNEDEITEAQRRYPGTNVYNPTSSAMILSQRDQDLGFCFADPL